MNSRVCVSVTLKSNNTNIIYKNSIVSSNSSGVITRHGQFRVDFSCYYTKPGVKSVSFRIKNRCVWRPAEPHLVVNVVGVQV